jgi:hypothetical protein
MYLCKLKTLLLKIIKKYKQNFTLPVLFFPRLHLSIIVQFIPDEIVTMLIQLCRFHRQERLLKRTELLLAKDFYWRQDKRLLMLAGSAIAMNND